MARFPQDFSEASDIEAEDKIIVGKKSDGGTYVFKFGQLVSKINTVIVENIAFIWKLFNGFTIQELRNITDFQLVLVTRFKCNQIGYIPNWGHFGAVYIEGNPNTYDNGFTQIVTETGKVITAFGYEKNTVEYWGAKADGDTDSTTAIQKAVNYAYKNTSNGKDRVVYFNGTGTYLLGKINCPADGTITLSGIGLYSAFLKLKDNANESMFVVPRGGCVPFFSRLYMDGNKENQSSTDSHGIEYQDEITPAYKRAGMIENCHIIGFKGDGIHGGAYKQLLRITNTDIRKCDGHGVYQPLNCADWFINSGDYGNNGKCNLYISSQVQVENASIYYAGQHNIYFGEHTRWSSVIATLIDHAGQHGIFIETNAANPCGVNLQGNRFYLNGISVNNTYSHIKLKNANGTIITNNHFQKIPGVDNDFNTAKYLVETENSFDTHFFGNKWDAGSYATNVTNDFSVMGNQNCESIVGKARVTGNLRVHKNINFGDEFVGNATGQILNLFKLVFGSGNPDQTLGAGRIYPNAANNQLIIEYGSTGLVFKNNGGVVTLFADILSRVFFNTTNTYQSAQMGVDSGTTPRGFLTCRWNTVSRNNINIPATGLAGFDTDYMLPAYYNSAGWAVLNTGITTNVSTNDYQILKTDRLIIVNSSVARNVTLPSSVAISDKEFVVKNIGTANVTILTLLSQKIDNSNSVIVAAGAAIRLVSVGTGYIII